MLLTILVLTTLCGIAQSSGIGHADSVGAAPVVTAASSQYFERTFNRLIAPVPRNPEPVPPIAPVVPVIPVGPSPPVLITPVSNSVPASVNPTIPAASSHPNVAIAVATAHAAAPVATFLLPPYPFGLPPGYAFTPEQQTVPPEVNTKKVTTQPSTTRQTEATTTEREQESTPVPSNSDNSLVQALPSNENVNFKQYGLPLPQRPYQLPRQLPQQPWPHTLPRPKQQWAQQPKPQSAGWPQQQPKQPRWHQPSPHYHIHGKPQKLRTSVEIVPVPLAYITPPPIKAPLTNNHIKVIKHIYGFIPNNKAKIIIRPKINLHRVHSVNGLHLAAYKTPISGRNIRLQTFQPANGNAEPTTFNPFPRPSNKPPRLLD